MTSAAIAPPAPAPAGAEVSPWHFLSPLAGDSAADRELIELTRSDELRNVVDMIATSRVSLLYAYSGNGKTSLIDAGIIPTFRRRGQAVFKTRPRPPGSIQDPLRAFKDSVLTGMNLPLFTRAEIQRLHELHDGMSGTPGPLPPEVRRFLANLDAKLSRVSLTSPDNDFASHLAARIDLPLAGFIAEIQRHVGPETRLLFVCDQFEELFVHYQGSPAVERFVAEVGAAWADRALNLHFLFSMREDWVGSMIAFRREIPEIFASYYRLSPLTRRQAVGVLVGPLTKLGLRWEDGAVSALLQDLASAYSVNQTDRRHGVSLEFSPTDDPYIELPALQVVADQLWRTRTRHPKPFSLAHYRALPELTGAVAAAVGQAATAGQAVRAAQAGQGAEAGQAAEAAQAEQTVEVRSGESPAAWVLQHFLRRRLDLIAAGEAPDAAPTELRIDCLYALTDGMRHRRALDRGSLVEETRRLRPSALELAPVEAASIEAAIRPLADDGLVRRTQGAGERVELELAHDFAVRSVVDLWHGLDQQRTAEVALRRREREEKDAALSEAAARERRRLHFIRYVPGIAAGCVLALLATFPPVWGEERELVFRKTVLALPLLLTILATVALSARRFAAAAAALLALGGVLLTAGLETDFLVRRPVPLPTMYSLPASFSGRHLNTSMDRDLFGIVAQESTRVTIYSDVRLTVDRDSGFPVDLKPTSVGTPSQPMELPYSRVIALAPGITWFALSEEFPGLAYKMDLVPEGTRPVSVTDAISRVGWSPEDSTIFLLVAVAIALIPLSCINLLQIANSTGSAADRWIVRLQVAEVIDTFECLAAWALAMLTFGSIIKSSGLLVGLGVPISALLLASIHRLLGTTGGLATCGLRLTDRHGGTTLPQTSDTMVRQLAFSVWAFINLCGLLTPSFFLTPFIARRSPTRQPQTWYDRLAGTRVVEKQAAVESEPDAKAVPSA